MAWTEMSYSDTGLAFIAVALFATGVWVESNDDDPQIGRAGIWGGTYVVTGWFILTLVEKFGVLP